MKNIVKLTLTLSKGVTLDLVEWLNANIKKKHESIDISYWTNNFWYVEIIDKRYDLGMSCWFTIDIVNNKILWNNEKGNCGLRSKRWAKLVKAKFPNLKAHEHFHDYRKTSGKIKTKRKYDASQPH